MHFMSKQVGLYYTILRVLDRLPGPGYMFDS